MGNVIQAKDVFLAKAQDELEAKELDEELHQKAMKAAELHVAGLTGLSVNIINSIEVKDRGVFRAYMLEAMKLYEA